MSNKAINNNSRHSTLIETYFKELKACACNGPILDLACGDGRNGLFLDNQGLPVVFADYSESALHTVNTQLDMMTTKSSIWPVHLEQPGINPFENKHFSAALVFRYLHRPLMPALLKAVIPGGLVVYETFTVENKAFGRPNNADFLLHLGELNDMFNGWETLHYFEGILDNPTRAVAQIVCRKPL